MVVPSLSGSRTTILEWQDLTLLSLFQVTIDRSRPLTYEMAFKPEEIADKKDYNSYNTSQLEGTFLHKEDIGQDLPHKTFVEDSFIRK